MRDVAFLVKTYFLLYLDKKKKSEIFYFFLGGEVKKETGPFLEDRSSVCPSCQG